jgi:hypothetical protein
MVSVSGYRDLLAPLPDRPGVESCIQQARGFRLEIR